jgi:AraC-like DNA-binding protein
MTMSGQVLSPTGQAYLQPFETAPRPLVGFSRDYPDGWRTGQHAHPRAQLLYAVSGVMRIDTPGTAYLVPPAAALFMPADQMHAVAMDGPVAMRALFLRADAVRRGPQAMAVIAVSALLRELILAACAEPVRWDLRGRGRHLAALAMDEIARAETLPLTLPIPRDPRLQRVTEALRRRPDDPRDIAAFGEAAGASSRTLARLFRSETGMSFRQWRRQVRLTEALSALSGGASLAKAAAIAGYASQPAFGAAFLEAFGMTPGGRQR